MDVKKLRELYEESGLGLLQVDDMIIETHDRELIAVTLKTRHGIDRSHINAKYLAVAANALPKALDKIEQLEKALESAKKNNFTCSSCGRNFIEEEIYHGNTCFSCFRSVDP